MDINPDFPVGNAAGWCKSVSEVEALVRSAASFIVVGSITMEPRDGNPGNTFNGDPVFALNSLGLPNPGLDKLEEIGPEMVRIAHAAEKPIIASIAGFFAEEFGELASRVQRIGFDGIEVNLGCPNIADGGKRKPIFSYRKALTEDSLSAVCNYIDALRPDWFISVKVSPMDPDRLDEIASVIEEFPVSAVITQNTVPNCLDINLTTRKPIIDTPDKRGYAGGSGIQIFQQALGQVKQWRERLPGEIQVWGVGGVQTGEDVKKMLWAGASAVEVGTSYFISGAKVFGEIAGQFVNLS